MKGIKINKTLRNCLIAVVAIAAVFVITSLIPDKDFHEKYEGFDLAAVEGVGSSTKGYDEYISEHADARNANSTVEIDVFSYAKDKSTGVSYEANYHGKNVVVTDERSSVTWNFDVPETGFYNIGIEYIGTPSRNVNMERILYVNGKIPFTGADLLSFYRLWKDGGPVKQDNQGNSIRPTQVEFFDYQTVLLKSDLGYEVDPYRFYFEKGQNSITLEIGRAFVCCRK